MVTKALFIEAFSFLIPIQNSGSSEQPCPRQSQYTKVCIELVVFVRAGVDQLKAL